MLLLPGQDPEQEESLSMLEGGNWCSRKTVTGEENITLQVRMKWNRVWPIWVFLWGKGEEEEKV